MTVEQILDKNYRPKMHWKSVNRNLVLDCMDEFARLRALAFLEWVRDHPDLNEVPPYELWNLFLITK